MGGGAEKEEEEGEKGEKPISSPPCCTFNKSVRGYNEPLFTGCLNNTCAALPETRFCRPLATTLAPPYIYPPLMAVTLLLWTLLLLLLLFGLFYASLLL